MSLDDTMVRFRARLAPNQPSQALNDGSRLVAAAQAVLAEVEDVRQAIAAIQPTLFWSQAQGQDLINRAADYGVQAGTGTAATGSGIFQTAAGATPPPSQTTLTYPAGTVVGTTGDGITSSQVLFTTSAVATISQGCGTSGTPQIETVTITGSPTGGTFTLTHAGQTTAAIAYNASAATVQSALQALSNVGTNSVTGQPNVSVTGSAGGPYTVSWVGALQGLSFTAMSAASSLTGGTSPNVSSAITSVVTGVAITCTAAGIAGNVSAGAVSLIVTQNVPGVFTNLANIANGVDPDSPATIRNNIAKAIFPRYGTAAVEAAVLAVPGVYDCYCYDPQNGSGTITVYWCDQYGNQTNASYPNLSANVQAAVNAVLPPDLAASYATFTVDNLTAVAVTYSAPAAVQTSTVGPQIQAAIAAYIQGNGAPRSGLYHNMVPNGFSMGSAVQTGLNPQSGAQLGVTAVPGLYLFNLTGSTPAIGSASNTTIYRLTGSPSSVITLTRQ